MKKMAYISSLFILVCTSLSAGMSFCKDCYSSQEMTGTVDQRGCPCKNCPCGQQEEGKN